MPVYTFIAENETAIPAGYAQRITVSTRVNQPWNDNGQMKGPEVYALRMAFDPRNQIPYVPNHVYKPYLVSQDAPKGDMILGWIPAQPSTTRVQTNAPYADPIGNRGQNFIPLPVAGQQRPSQAGDLELLPDDALPVSGGDGLLGDQDGWGGTHEDISPTTGQIYKRPRGDERVISGPAHQGQ